MGIKVKFTEYEVIPAGNYIAKLLDIKPKAGMQYGDGLIWTFEIIDGYLPSVESYVGLQVGGVTGDVATPNSKLTKFLTGFNITAIPGEEVDIDVAKGKIVRIRVSETKKDPEKTGVDGVAPYDPKLLKHKGYLAQMAEKNAPASNDSAGAGTTDLNVDF